MTIYDIAPGQKLKLSIYGQINAVKNFQGTVAGLVLGSYVPQTADPSINHANIYPTLPAERKEAFQDIYTSYQYIQLIQEDDSVVYIGLPWINDATIESLEDVICDIRLVNFDASRRDELALKLAQWNFEVKTMTVTAG